MSALDSKSLGPATGRWRLHGFGNLQPSSLDFVLGQAFVRARTGHDEDSDSLAASGIGLDDPPRRSQPLCHLWWLKAAEQEGGSRAMLASLTLGRNTRPLLLGQIPLGFIKGERQRLALWIALGLVSDPGCRVGRDLPVIRAEPENRFARRGNSRLSYRARSGAE
jgi:hypothetical protein